MRNWFFSHRRFLSVLDAVSARQARVKQLGHDLTFICFEEIHFPQDLSEMIADMIIEPAHNRILLLHPELHRLSSVCA